MTTLRKVGQWMCMPLLVMAAAGAAWGVPSFARQTGLPCSRCHITFPELTAFGRQFKLNGYTLSGKNTPKIYKPGSKNEAGLWLNENLPLSAMFQISDTLTRKAQPGTQNGNIEFPQQLSLFLAGELATHMGSFIQVTYNTQGDHFSMDNTDIRYANLRYFGSKPLVYGLDLNNNPTVEDLWNDTPAWGFPWAGPDSSPSPMASTLIDGGLAQDVGGVGAYAMYNNSFYGDFTLYRSMHIGGPQPPDGKGFGINISGVAPYWRGAYQTTWGSGLNYLEVGTYGMHVNSFPNTIGGAENRYTDAAGDAQYERHLGKDTLTLHTTYIHESSNLFGTLAARGASFAAHKLHTFKLDGLYHLGNMYAFGGGGFSTSGTADATLFASGALNGSNNGSPDSNGYILEASYWPVQNISLQLYYLGFTKFNGASTNYDGAGRNASDNNTLYINLWLMF